ncbi:chloride channel protein [Necropsobacter rosorum]|uniref:chloride channel protein n=1 Tax=Necropsobacter rosorum TaxID=908285 RepID=UPI000509404F
MPLFRSKFLFSLLGVGIIAGLVGILLTLLLHHVQHYVFDYGFNTPMSFREGVEDAAPWRRFWALIACGAAAGLGWMSIHRWGKPLVEVKSAVNNGQSMPFVTTISHALLQIITVGMGSPLGREVAPREMSVAFAEQWSRHTGLNAEERRILLACASGAGLAAVYNVPFAAVIFILETLLLAWQPRLVVSALITCSSAVAVVRMGLGDGIQYPMTDIPLNQNFLLWALAAGPLLGLGVYLFDRCIAGLPELPRRSPRMLLFSLATFGLIGLMAVYYPDILGNGKAGNQLSFHALIGWREAAELLAAKWFAVLLAMLAGAYGGRITPSMMLGGLLAFLSAALWNALLPEIPLGAAALIGAAVFLGLAQKMLLTAMVFMLELTRLSPAYWLPMCLCTAGALLLHRYLSATASHAPTNR